MFNKQRARIESAFPGTPLYTACVDDLYEETVDERVSEILGSAELLYDALDAQSAMDWDSGLYQLAQEFADASPTTFIQKAVALQKFFQDVATQQAESEQ